MTEWARRYPRGKAHFIVGEMGLYLCGRGQLGPYRYEWQKVDPPRAANVLCKDCKKIIKGMG